jgi:transposase-like protein
MGALRRQYTDEFKREALGLLASGGRPLSQIAGELGIPAGTDLAFKNGRLRRENERLRMEREILKERCASSQSHRNEIPHH